MNNDIKPILETNNFIVLDKYIREWDVDASYQSEADLERELIADLRKQGYEYNKDIVSTKNMLDNLKLQKENLMKKWLFPKWK